MDKCIKLLFHINEIPEMASQSKLLIEIEDTTTKRFSNSYHLTDGMNFSVFARERKEDSDSPVSGSTEMND